MKRIGRAFAIALGVSLAATASHAQTAKYPDRPVKVVVGFTAGGGTDVAARVLAQKLSEAFGQSFVVENRPGASGLIATEAMAKSPADGYTLMVGSQTTLAVAPALYPKFTIDATKDVAGISMIGISPLVAVVNANSPIKSIADLIALAKEKAGTLNFGSGGVGTTPHMAGELLKLRIGADMAHVPYKGSGPAMAELVAGQVQLSFSSITAALPFIKDGRLRALATTGSKRSPALPEQPTVSEAGYPGFEVDLWLGVFAPAGTPAQTLARINTEIRMAVQDPAVGAAFAKVGVEPRSATAEEGARFVRAESEKWARVVTDGKLKTAK